VLHLPLHPQNEEGMAIVDLPAGAASPAAFCGRFLLHAHLWHFSPFAASFSPPTVTSPTPTDPPSPLLVAARTHDCDHPRPQWERQHVADDLPDGLSRKRRSRTERLLLWHAVSATRTRRGAAGGPSRSSSDAGTIGSKEQGRHHLPWQCHHRTHARDPVIS
jgi:hypothetical protein